MDVPQLIMGLGSLFAGVSSLRNAFKKNQRRGGVSGLGRLQLTGEHKSANGQAGAKIYKVHSIDERLAGVAKQMMASVRDPRVRQLAVSIVSKRSRSHNNQTGDGGWAINERDYWSEVKAIFNWFRANVRYIRDIATIDTFATAMRTIEVRGADCDDYTIALGAFLMSIGYSVRMKTIQTKDSEDWNHIYLQVALPPGAPNKNTKWKTLDASVAQPAGWEAPASIIAKWRVDAPEDGKWNKYW